MRVYRDKFEAISVSDQGRRLGVHERVIDERHATSLRQLVGYIRTQHLFRQVAREHCLLCLKVNGYSPYAEEGQPVAESEAVETAWDQQGVLLLSNEKLASHI